ncbi:MAG: PTS-dependent dihydroxyacetone kinase phosphotransferase subunit DhaM [Ktedonobacteraceae bacterium]|nr:PTS-dependent dihydroxyacetone kinase phosphotransferase subunit DhaM [Ktedonobacteraceae bacterium]
MAVGLVIVSHSARLAEGVAELAGQMAQGKVAIAVAGGTVEGRLGTSVEKILAALRQVDGPDGILVLLDLGSAVMATEMAVEAFAHDSPHKVTISPAPLVEGAVIAAVEASVGNSLEEVAEAAIGAATLPKITVRN